MAPSGRLEIGSLVRLGTPATQETGCSRRAMFVNVAAKQHHFRAFVSSLARIAAELMKDPRVVGTVPGA